MIMEIFLLILGIVVGWIVGRFHMTVQLINSSTNMLNRLQEKQQTSVFYTTVSDKYVYLYNKKTDEFVMQDTTFESLISKAYELGKISTAVVVIHEEDSLLVYKGKVTNES